MTSRGRRAPVQGGRLYVVGTPIGNLEDITYRAVRVLGEVDLIAAEDTRSARTLLGRYEIATPTTSYFKGNEAQRAAQLVERLREGQALALISESGLPGVSDPGERLVQCCLEAGVPVEVIPGPNAALTALVLSGLPTSRFCFVGFLPRKGRRRRETLQDLAVEPGSIVLYEAPGRVAATLADLRGACGDRQAAVARELTKLHEEVARGSLSALEERYAETPPRGEVTVVVAGAAESPPVEMEDLAVEIRVRLARGERPRQIADVLGAHGRRRVYQAALALRDEAEPQDEPELEGRD